MPSIAAVTESHHARPRIRCTRTTSGRFDTNRFVYPVLSRRSGGISLGVNLNPDKVCNFDCIYCQVDRTRQSETRFVETDAAARRARRHAATGRLGRALRDAQVPRHAASTCAG